MTKAELLTLLATLVGVYYSASGVRLAELKIFCFWLSLIVLCISDIHNIYLFVTNDHMPLWIRYAASNVSAIGLCVLVVVGFVFKPHIREHFMSKVRQA